MNILKLILKFFSKEKSNSESSVITIKRDEKGNIIKRVYSNGLIIRYSYDMLNRENELRTSEGYTELTTYYNSSNRKKEVYYTYKRQRWMDKITLDGYRTTHYLDREGTPI